jgi:hypothetical protein
MFLHIDHNIIFQEKFKCLPKITRYLVSRNDRLIGGHGEVDPRIGHQVRLELVQVDVQGSVEPEKQMVHGSQGAGS